MPRAPKPSPILATHNTVLKRNQACHRCRRRKLKCDAQKPCSACVRSQTIAVNAGESADAIECTYDDALAQVEELRAEVERLQLRNKELEDTLTQKDSGLFPPQSSSGSSSSSAPTPDVPHASPELSKNKDPAPNSTSPYPFLAHETPWSSTGDISLGLPQLFAQSML